MKKLLIVAILIVVFDVFLAGMSVGINRVKNEAIQNNAAEWQVDAKTGKVEFCWKAIKE